MIVEMPTLLMKTSTFHWKGYVWLYGHKTMTQEGNGPTPVVFERLSYLLLISHLPKVTTLGRDRAEIQIQSSLSCAKPTQLLIQFLFQLELNTRPAFFFFSYNHQVSITNLFWSTTSICILVKTSTNLQPKLLLNEEIFLSEKQQSMQRNSFAKTYIQFALPNSTLILLV